MPRGFERSRIMRYTKFVLAASLFYWLVAAGCATPNSRLTICQQEKEQLLSTIRGQRDSNRALTDQLASLETRLDQAEKELARSGSGTRLSSRPSETPPTIRNESLPWRSPAGKSDSSSSA